MAAAASSEEGQVIACHSKQEFEAHLKKADECKKPIVIDFTASWCGPCRFIAPILAEIAKKTTNVVFLKVDVDEVKEVSELYKVEAMPTFVFLKDGKEVHKLVGARKEELQAKIMELGGGPYVASA